MSTIFLEPGGEADLAIATTNGFWTSSAGSPSVVSDIVHSPHIRSLKFAANASDSVTKTGSILFGAGSRISFYHYFVAKPSTTTTLWRTRDSGNNTSVTLKMTSAGVLQLWNGNIAQIGTNGATLATGQWYRISLALTITSGTVNRFELFVNGVSSISVTNATITTTGIDGIGWGNFDADLTLDFRSSDHYIDNSNALTDPGDIWVTAKRPNANGTTNNFTTQIGSGGSGYGSGHSPQVNERPLDKTDGWSMIGAGAAVTEEYSVEGISVGDMNLTGKTIVDWLGWISADATVGESGSIIAGGVSSSYTLPASPSTRLVTKIVGSTVYPAGGTDVGIITDTTVTTVSLYECGVIIAFIGPPAPAPVVATAKNIATLLLMGAG